MTPHTTTTATFAVAFRKRHGERATREGDCDIHTYTLQVGETPLHLSSINHANDLSIWLIDQGANLDTRAHGEVCIYLPTYYLRNCIMIYKSPPHPPSRPVLLSLFLYLPFTLSLFFFILSVSTFLRRLSVSVTECLCD